MRVAKPKVVVNRAAASRVRAGYPWVFATDIVAAPDGSLDMDVVEVVDRAGRLLGTALYAAGSRLALRVLGGGELTLDRGLLEERIRRAAARRQRWFGSSDAHRVVHAEADRLPGLVVDRYRDVAVVQTAARAMDAREPEIAEAVAAVLGVRLVIARDDGSARDFEGLPRRRGVLWGTGATTVVYEEAGSRFETDLLTDSKTGSFLDQAENHRQAQCYATGEALDAFTYHGGFALALARGGATSVLALDEADEAVARTRHNAAHNQLTQVTVAQRNAFDALRQFEAEGRSFDVVVLDPPALAKRKSGMAAAERAYKELNLRGWRLLRAGGVLITCSCSGKLSAERFGAIVAAAARDAGRAVQLLERRSAGRDHPALLGVPETDYLKCWFLRVLE